MRYAALCCAFALFAAPAPAQEGLGRVPGGKPVEFLPQNFRVKMVGQFQKQFRFAVARVLDKKTAVVRLGTMPPFIVQGIDTADLADGQRVALPGPWLVNRPREVDGRRLFVLTPAKK